LERTIVVVVLQSQIVK